MRPKSARGLWGERRAARYLGVGQETLREYVRKGMISAACRIEKRVRDNCLTRTYRFQKETLDAYDRRRREGYARRGCRRDGLLSRTDSRRAENLAEVRHKFDHTDSSLREIGTAFGLSHTAIWFAIREMGYDYAAREKRIRKGQKQMRQSARLEKPLDAKIEVVPQWYLAVIRECLERGIRFEPSLIQLENGSKIDFHRARLNQRETRIRFAACTCLTTREAHARYGILRHTDRILAAHALLAVVTVDGKFHFWSIPGAVARKRSNISLTVDREVCAPFGLGAMIYSSSQWWKYYGEEAWRLFAP